MMKRQTIHFAIVTFMGMSALLLMSQANAGPHVPTTYEPDWEPAAPGTEITNPTNSPFGAQLPVIRYAPDASRILIAYEKRLDGSIEGVPDPWYSLSTNQGQSWSAPLPIYESASLASVEVELALDNTGAAHAVWVEGSGPFSLMYSKESNWPGTPTVLFDTEIFLAGPVIVASGSNTLDVVWSAHDFDQIPPDVNPNIYHSRSINGGTSWTTPVRVFQSEPTSSFPGLAVDSSGTLHLVWEEEASGVMYSKGTASGSTVTWSAPYVMSDGKGIFEAKQPHILTYDTSVLVSFTNFADFQQQWIFYAVCTTDCDIVDDWPGPFSLSSQPLGANTTDPAVINAELAYNGCAYGYYFGTEIGGINPENEIVWGANSCDNWGAGFRDQVTENASRSIYQSITAAGNWLQLVYEQISVSGRHLYHRRGLVVDPATPTPTPSPSATPPGPDGLYLPMIPRR